MSQDGDGSLYLLGQNLNLYQNGTIYIYIFIYILRERERDNVSGNNNHRKSHQKTPHSYLSCQHQVGQWLSDHDALQSVTGELMGG